MRMNIFIDFPTFPDQHALNKHHHKPTCHRRNYKHRTIFNRCHDSIISAVAGDIRGTVSKRSVLWPIQIFSYVSAHISDDDVNPFINLILFDLPQWASVCLADEENTHAN